MTQTIKTNVLDRFPDYEITIGVEVHIQLNTASKMFCSCPSKFGDEPNNNICPTCAGLLGILPVINRRAVESAILLGLATNSSITKVSEFARKHYVYPDLPKNYQISQDDKPICTDGSIQIILPDGTSKSIRIMRIHMEEDAGKNIHSKHSNETLVDLNRAGTPLLEVVTEPDLSSKEEVRTYMMQLRSIVKYLGISEANMEEGSFRGDINISVAKKGADKLGTRCELKNINSFKYICQAIDYEVERQITLLESGESIVQATRLWNQKEHRTEFMRAKEDSLDYRFYTDPDLPLLIIDDEWIARLRSSLPELPHEKFDRLISDFELTPYEAEIIISQRPLADYFEKTVALCNQPKMVANWTLRNLLGYLNEHDVTLAEIKITPEMFAEFINVIKQGLINTKTGQEVFVLMAETGKYPSIIIQENGLEQLNSKEDITAIIRKIITDNPKQVEAYRGGKDRLFSFFIGQAMKATSGKANPKLLKEITEEELQNE